MQSTARTRVILADGKEKEFIRHSITKSSSRGLRKSPSFTFDIFTAKRQKTKTTVEMNANDPKDFLLILRSEDYYKSRTRKTLVKLIGDLNRRYSEDSDNDFYSTATLPPQEEIDSFKRIHAMTRIFIQGKKVHRELLSRKTDELKNLLKQHFSYHAKIIPRKPDPQDYLEIRLVAYVSIVS